MEEVIYITIQDIISLLENEPKVSYTYNNDVFHIINDKNGINMKIKLKGNNRFVIKENNLNLSYQFNKKYLNSDIALYQITMLDDSDASYFSFLEKDGLTDLVGYVYINRKDKTDFATCKNNKVYKNENVLEVLEYANEIFDKKLAEYEEENDEELDFFDDEEDYDNEIEDDIDDFELDENDNEIDREEELEEYLDEVGVDDDVNKITFKYEEYGEELLRKMNADLENKEYNFSKKMDDELENQYGNYELKVGKSLLSDKHRILLIDNFDKQVENIYSESTKVQEAVQNLNVVLKSIMKVTKRMESEREK